MKGDEGEEKYGDQKKVDDKDPIKRESVIGEGAEDHGSVGGDQVEKRVDDEFNSPNEKERPEPFYLRDPDEQQGEQEGDGDNERDRIGQVSVILQREFPAEERPQDKVSIREDSCRDSGNGPPLSRVTGELALPQRLSVNLLD